MGKNKFEGLVDGLVNGFLRVVMKTEFKLRVVMKIACSYENWIGKIRADSLCFRHQKLISILPKVTIPFKRYVAATVKVVSNIYERFND